VLVLRGPDFVYIYKYVYNIYVFICTYVCGGEGGGAGGCKAVLQYPAPPASISGQYFRLHLHGMF
jgi:hypothetical protein